MKASVTTRIDISRRSYHHMCVVDSRPITTAIKRFRELELAVTSEHGIETIAIEFSRTNHFDIVKSTRSGKHGTAGEAQGCAIITVTRHGNLLVSNAESRNVIFGRHHKRRAAF